MIKTAYIMGVPGVDERKCCRIHETEMSVTLMAAVSCVESAERLVERLAGDGYDVINLGMGFGEVLTPEMQEIAGSNVKVRCVEYTIDECVMRIRVERDRSHGVIMTVAGIDKPCEFFIPDKEHDTRIILVKNMTQAKNAARKLVKYNVGFIELSTWFDIFRMEEIIDAIDGAVAVGTCGILDILELDRLGAEPEVDPEKLKPKKRVYTRRKKSGE